MFLKGQTMIWKRTAWVLAIVAMFSCLAAGADPAASAYQTWANGPSKDPGFFPIAVWLQNPQNAVRYKQAGINTFVGLWKGPTETQLNQLAAAGIKLICEQNEVALKNLENPVIIGWMHGDEPDNAQSLGEGKGYGPPVPIETIVKDYHRIRVADPTRPVMLNLGQGVAWDGWYGRGIRTNHPEDYPGYIEGCDIASFDIYPACHDRPQVAGKLWFVANGVERLVKWSGGKKIVWNCIECTRIGNETTKATPQQVKAEVWMSIIHGSRGLIYFVHEWKPKFNEAALLSDPEMLKGITEVNQQIHRLAAVINGRPPEGKVTVTTTPSEIPVAILARQGKEALFVFAVNMRGEPANASLTAAGIPKDAKVEVVDEGRTIPSAEGSWKDDFAPWAVHIYRIASSL
jgi:hypothetical protein